jgi:hypothetical protein
MTDSVANTETRVCNLCAVEQPLTTNYTKAIIYTKTNPMKTVYNHRCKQCCSDVKMLKYVPRPRGLKILTEEEKKDIKEMLLNGIKICKIAKKYENKISRVSILNWSKKIEILD